MLLLRFFYSFFYSGQHGLNLIILRAMRKICDNFSTVCVLSENYRILLSDEYSAFEHFKSAEISHIFRQGTSPCLIISQRKMRTTNSRPHIFFYSVINFFIRLYPSSRYMPVAFADSSSIDLTPLSFSFDF